MIRHFHFHPGVEDELALLNRKGRCSTTSSHKVCSCQVTVTWRCGSKKTEEIPDFSRIFSCYFSEVLQFSLHVDGFLSCKGTGTFLPRLPDHFFASFILSGFLSLSWATACTIRSALCGWLACSLSLQWQRSSSQCFLSLQRVQALRRKGPRTWPSSPCEQPQTRVSALDQWQVTSWFIWVNWLLVKTN